MRFRKSYLFVANVILFIVGVIVIAIASVSIYTGNKYGELLLGPSTTTPVIILVLGITIIILGFLGIAGAVRESKYILYTYAVVMLVFLLAMVASAIYLLIHPGVSKSAFKSSMHKQLQKYNESKPNEACRMKIDGVQKYEQCCGVNGPQYWTNLGKEIPDSCLCQTEDKNCKRSSDNSYYYQQGCAEAIIKDRKSIRIALGVTTLILALVMFFSIISAFGLAKANQYNQTKVRFII